MSQFLEKIFDFSFSAAKPSLPIVVWAIYAGVMIAVALSLASRVWSYKLVYALMAAKAGSPDTAKTFSDLGLGKHPIYKLIFRKNSPLRKYIRYNGSEMYIPEERRIGASVRFSREKHPIMTFVFAAIAFFIIACLVIIYLPQILDAYSSLGQ